MGGIALHAPLAVTRAILVRHNALLVRHNSPLSPRGPQAPACAPYAILDTPGQDVLLALLEPTNPALDLEPAVFCVVKILTRSSLPHLQRPIAFVIPATPDRQVLGAAFALLVCTNRPCRRPLAHSVQQTRQRRHPGQRRWSNVSANWATLVQTEVHARRVLRDRTKARLVRSRAPTVLLVSLPRALAVQPRVSAAPATLVILSHPVSAVHAISARSRRQ